jgi:hypothetical protein
MELGHGMNARAASRIFDEIGATTLHDSLNDLRLRYPGVGIADIEGLIENCGQDAPKSN